MNTTATYPPALKALIARFKAQGLHVTVGQPVESDSGITYPLSISVAPRPCRSPLSEFVAGSLAGRLHHANSLIQGIRGRLARAGFDSTITQALDELVACWNARPKANPSPPSDKSYPASHEAARKEAAASLLVVATEEQAGDLAASRLKPARTEPPTPTPPPAFPRLHWRFTGFTDCLGAYLPSDPEITLYEITPRYDGQPGYALDGLTVPDTAATLGDTILDLQQTAQRELEAWLKRHSASFPN